MLKTQDMLSKWLTIQDMKCPLCNGCKDSHSHLFFVCPFSKILWERLKGLDKLHDLSNTWGEVVFGIVNKPAKNSIWSFIQRLLFGAVVYFIWQERNMRLFGNGGRSIDSVYSKIVETVRFKLMGLIMKQSLDVQNAARIWNLPLKFFGYHDERMASYNFL